VILNFCFIKSEAEIILTIFLAKWAWHSYKIYSYKKTCIWISHICLNII